jgi:hypothetical protein
MALLSPTTLEDHPAGTLNLGGIINDNWAKINKIFDPSLSDTDPLYGLIALAVRGQGTGLTTITYSATPDIDFNQFATQLIILSGDAAFTFSNLNISRSVRLLISAGASSRSLSWPSGVNWVNDAVPATIAANSYLIVELVSQTTTATDVWGAFFSNGGFDAYKEKVLSISPVAYWPLDETSGTSFADATGGGYTGTSSGTVTVNSNQSIIGSSTKSPNFVAASSGVIVVPTASALQFTPNVNPWSVSLWMRVATADVYTVISKTGGGTNRNFQLTLSSSPNNFSVAIGGGLSNFVAVSLNDNLWKHFVVASDGTTALIYYNGQQVGSMSCGTQAENAVDWLIGARRTGGTNVNTGTSNFHNGGIGHVAFFSRQLTANEVGRLSFGRDSI